MFLKKLLPVFTLLISAHIHADVIPYKEDTYTQQAPEEIVILAKQAADLMNFKDGFEVMIPKKAGIEINPWNKFVGYGKNPSTQNSFILINPEWFSGIPHDQQVFLLARCFTTLQEGSLPSTSLQIIWILYCILSILLMILCYWLLGKTTLQPRKWLRVICAIGIIILGELFIFDKIHLYIVRHVSQNFDVGIIKKVIEKIGNKDAAIKALQHLDASIKQAAQSGETFFVPYKDLFEKYVHEITDKK
jgi:hypothetical protein